MFTIVYIPICIYVRVYCIRMTSHVGLRAAYIHMYLYVCTHYIIGA